MASVAELGDKIANLTIAQAVELKNYLKEKYNIEPAAGGAVMMAGPAAAAAAAAEGRRVDRVQRHPRGRLRRGQEDQHHQGRPRNHRPGPDGSQGSSSKARRRPSRKTWTRRPPRR